MDAIRTLRSSLTRALENSFDEAIRNVEAEISYRDANAQTAEQRATNAEKERSRALEELDSLKDAITLLREELRLTDFGSEDDKVSTKKFRDFEAAYAPNQVLQHFSHAFGDDVSGINPYEIKAVTEAYTALYGEAQELVMASCELRKQVKRYKGKLKFWQKCLELDKFTLVLEGTAIEFRCTGKVSIDTQRKSRATNPTISVPVSGLNDHDIADETAISPPETLRTNHPDNGDAGHWDAKNRDRSKCNGSIRLSPAQSTLTQSGLSENENVIPTAQVSTSGMKAAESESIKSQNAPKAFMNRCSTLTTGVRNAALDSTLVKDEDLSPEPSPKRSSAVRVMGTQDLDEVGNIVETPRKRRKVRNSEVRGVLLRTTTPAISEDSRDARPPPPLSLFSPKQPAMLESSNANPGGGRCARSPEKPQEEAQRPPANAHISSILEDGDESFSSPPSRKLRRTSEAGASGLTPGVGSEATTDQRLQGLLEGQSPAKLELQSMLRNSGVSDRALKHPFAIMEETPILTYNPDGFDIAEMPQIAPNSGASRTESVNNSLLSTRDTAVHPAGAIRARPVQHLDLKDFRINPDFNQGFDYAFHSVAHKKTEGKCVKGCTRYDCCGKKFLGLARMSGLPADATCSSQQREMNDQKILEEFVGDKEHLSRELSVEDRNHLLQEAKARLIANEFGKHKQQHQRAGSPPGFWRTDMPSTQELEHDHQEARRLEKDLVKDRYREAMRPGGLWKFADERGTPEPDCTPKRTASVRRSEPLATSSVLLILPFVEMDATCDTESAASAALLRPSRWLLLYEEFVTKNASSVSQIESALRSLTYIIPGRYRDSEISSECVHSGVQLLSLYHDALVSRVVSRLPPTIPRPIPTPHTRYTKYWTSRSSLYHKVALALQMVQYTELLWEMVARRRGEKIRWRVVIFIEAIKAVCRLLLLRLTKSRPLVTPPLPERDIDPRSLDKVDNDWNGMQTPVSERPSDLSWTMPRTGLSLPSLPEVNDVSHFLISKVLTADDIKTPKALLHRVTGQGQLAEVLYILRPVVYALALQKYSESRHSWRPWLVGFSLEYVCRQLAKSDFRERVAGGLRGLTGLEREELRKRGWAMGWWAMRGAFYTNLTRPWLRSLTGKMKGKPLLDLVGSVIDDYEYLWDNYYFSSVTL
ncbi:Pex16-domain-containing protein [Aspergillus violaceofuscus CBS 115571]|uniref:Pex16-domain-containing protein n=1 Tax=Aspergillus violaceofuscus (strain CBS 115571) TaxID=1450538 RepID=A0A2V5HWB9_ASPV1|nr:Pex16-domain-containing protein [Aspergillus violaceofuscus CBS 115571]